MLIAELMKSIIPTRKNKIDYAERYKLNQDMIYMRKSAEPVDAESDYTYEDHLKLVAEYERRQRAKNPVQRTLTPIIHNACDKIYLFATRNWPKNPDELKQ